MSGGFDDRDRDLEAAEYVLGTLDADERAAFALALKTDPASQRQVAAWEQRLAALGGRLDAVAPSAQVWDRIERALVAPTAKMHQFKVIDGGGGPAAEGAALRRSRDRWRTGALMTGAVAAALAIFVGDRVLKSQSETTRTTTAQETTAGNAAGDTYVAAVNRGGDKPALIVSVNLKSGRVLVRPVAATAPAGHSLELWYIGTDKTPRSMGLVAGEPASLSLPGGSASEAGTFAVSVEPPGGSKTGGPTGPVVYAGQLVKE